MPVSEEPITVTEFKLHDAYPNPFNPRTSIRYDLPKASKVSISIYDLMGRKVRNLVTGQVSAGSHITQWDASNDMGSQVSAGVYIYTISADDFREVKKMILLK
jgi:flagellar hook assembly protein FlgD